MVESLSCALCRRRGDTLVRVAANGFCTACLSSIGKLLCDGPAALVESLWRAPPRELARRALSDIVEDEIVKIRQSGPADDAAFESAIAAFKASLAPEPATPDGRSERSDTATHLDLAIAYREMGLTDEALVEAGIALSAADRLNDRAHEAAGIVLSPGCLRSGVDETLIRLRTVLFPG
jgi:hypothetical protein